MRTLKLQMHITIDGFVARTDGGMDWATVGLDEELRHRLLQNLNGIDCILMAMGRKSEMQFIPYWASVAANSKDPFYAYGKKLTDVSKVVVSNSLAHSDWPRTTVIKGDFIEETKKLKKLNGGDIIVFGGARFASSLIANRLVDEIHLLVNPVAIGNGLPIFQDVANKMEMTLAKATPFASGIVWLHYDCNTLATDS
ncbi:MAG: dihydrofolate reductase family protein [Bacteroidota bacterium]